jgi:hypothetical protein
VTPAGVTPEPLIAQHILFSLRLLLCGDSDEDYFLTTVTAAIAESAMRLILGSKTFYRVLLITSYDNFVQ